MIRYIDHMPRGVARAAGREMLLEAAQQLLEAAGPSALTVRSIAEAAGVATGLLYRHFGDRDELLVALVVRGFRTQAEQSADLHGRVGQDSVQANLSWYGHTVVQPGTRALARLMSVRPDLLASVQAALGRPDTPGLDHMEDTVQAYLEGEQRQGRVNPEAVTSSAAVILVSAWHRLLTSNPTATTSDADAVTNVVRTLVAGLDTDT